MVRAYPIDAKGNQIAPIRLFSDDQWNKLQKISKRWKLAKVEASRPVELIKKEGEAVTPCEETIEKVTSKRTRKNKKQRSE